MSQPPTTAVAPDAAIDEPTALTPQERRQLTLYKWRYALEGEGFGPESIQELLFLKWLYISRRIPS